MDSMLLDDSHFPKLIAGEKRLTIRRGYRPNVRLGLLDFCATNGSHPPVTVLVKGICSKRLAHLTDEEARLNGQPDAVTQIESLKKFYPDIDMGEVITIIHHSAPIDFSNAAS